MPSLFISLVDGILERKGREEYAGAHPFYSKSKYKFNTEKKHTGRFSANRKLTNTESMLQMVIGFLLCGGKPIHLNRGFQSYRKNSLKTYEIF